jgi:hypothetical protein
MARSHLTAAANAREVQRQTNVSRRRFLRGLGVAVAMPAFSSLDSETGRYAALGASPSGPVLAATATGAPLRTAFVYFPNGAIPGAWWPQGDSGSLNQDLTLNRTMEPLADLKDKFQIIGGLECRAADPGNDGGGSHARAGGSYLTGERARKTLTKIRAGVSIDQVIANHVGHLTPFRSIELTCDAVHTTGSCDSGYSCAYSYNLSWRSPHTPVAPESNPRLVFERMFGSGSNRDRKVSTQQRLAQQKSILDFVLEEARSVDRSLSSRDRLILDEYLTGVRDIEQRIEKAEQRPDPELGNRTPLPAGIPADYGAYIELMYDMIVLAFQTDQTRVSTFMLAHEGSNRSMPFLNIAEGHHTLSHHNNREEVIEKVKLIDRWYAQQFAGFLRKLGNVQDIDGNSLLHNSMICYGSGISDGNAHLHSNLPVLLAGAAGGTLRSGCYIRSDSTPIANLYLSMAKRMGCRTVTSHGDSTGQLSQI